MNVALTYNVKPDVQMSAPVSTPFPSLNPLSVSENLSAQIESSLDTDELFAEWDAPETIDAIESALRVVADVTRIDADEYAVDALRESQPDIVFNVAEGLYGSTRESYIPTICEFLQIPFTGSDGLTLALCLEKSRAKEILSYHKIPTASFHVVETIGALENIHIDFSSSKKFIKPIREGSGKGIFNSSIVSSFDELEREVYRVLKDYEQPALIEDYLEGKEYTAALLGNGSSLRVLPIIEMTFDGLPEEAHPIYGYESKWIYDLPNKPVDECYKCPAPLSFDEQMRVEQICKDAFTVLRCHDWCRIDVRCDRHGNPNIVELNPLPGVIPDPNAHSSFPMAAREAGLKYNDIIHTVLEAALQRYKMKSFIQEMKDSLHSINAHRSKK